MKQKEKKRAMFEEGDKESKVTEEKNGYEGIKKEMKEGMCEIKKKDFKKIGRNKKKNRKWEMKAEAVRKESRKVGYECENVKRRDGENKG